MHHKTFIAMYATIFLTCYHLRWSLIRRCRMAANFVISSLLSMVLASSLSIEISANEDSRSSLILFLKAVFNRPSAENDLSDETVVINRIALFALDRQWAKDSVRNYWHETFAYSQQCSTLCLGTVHSKSTAGVSLPIALTSSFSWKGSLAKGVFRSLSTLEAMI